MYMRKANTDTAYEFELYNGDDIVNMEIPDQSWLVRELIPDTSVNILAGEEGCGKSLLAMDLALGVAGDVDPWLAYNVVTHGKVLFLNNELSFHSLARRLKKIGAGHPRLSNLIVPQFVPSLDECQEALTSLCETHQPKLVVVDCLYMSHNRDEKDSSGMKDLMRQLLKLRDDFNLAVLAVHHTKKGSRFSTMHNDNMRGTGVFGAISDTVIQMRRSSADESKRLLKPTKLRDGEDANRKCRLLSLNAETLTFVDEGETNETDHIAGDTPTASEQIDLKRVFQDEKTLFRGQIIQRCSAFGFSQRTIDRLIKKAIENGTLKSAGHGQYTISTN